MIGLEFLRHRNRFLARVRRRYFSAEPSDSRKYVYARRLNRAWISVLVSIISFSTLYICPHFLCTLLRTRGKSVTDGSFRWRTIIRALITSDWFSRQKSGMSRVTHSHNQMDLDFKTFISTLYASVTHSLDLVHSFAASGYCFYYLHIIL